MSDILVFDRQDNLHMVDYCSPSGNKYTLCGEMYWKNSVITTLALDSAVRAMCRKCYEIFTKMYESDLDETPRTARGRLQQRLEQTFQNIQSKEWDVEHKYEILDERYWYKLNLYRRRSQRK